VLFVLDPDNGYITGEVLYVCGGTGVTENWRRVSVRG
jgi:hypothetical protein